MNRFAVAFCVAVVASVAGAEPPVGFTPLFNGKDFSGWRGRPHFDPAKEAEGTDEERAKRQQEWNADMAAHWKVENGVIVNDGHGVFLTTDRDYSDFELQLEWMFPKPCGDSGIYLRGNPQVQLWDPACDPQRRHGPVPRRPAHARRQAPPRPRPHKGAHRLRRPPRRSPLPQHPHQAAV